MITVIRRQLIENKAYKGIVWAMLILMVVSLGLPSLVSQSPRTDSWIALVNDIPIAYTDYTRIVTDYEHKIRMLRQQFGDSFMHHINPHTLALDALIRNELVGQVSRILPVALDEELIQNQLSDVNFVYQELSDVVPPHAIDPSTGIQNDQLEKHLRTIGMSHTDFQHKVTDSIHRSVMKDLIALAAYTPLTELEAEYQIEHAGKKFSVITVSYDDCLKQVKKKGVTPQELEAFFNEQVKTSERYHVAEKRAGIVATVHARDYGIVVSDADIEHYYAEHKMREFIDTPTRVQVRRLAVKTVKEAEELHDKLVHNPSLFETSGELLPAFARNSTQESAREKAAFLLKKDGDISGIVATSDGFEILQRVKRIPATFVSIAQARASIRTTLINKAFAALFNHDMELLTEKAEDKRGALDQYVMQHHGSVVERGLTHNDGSMLMNHLFALKQGQSTYYIEGSTATIVMLTKVEPRHIPPLSAVYASVEQDYYKEQARARVQEIMEQVSHESASSSWAELSARYDLSLMSTPSIKKSDEKTVASWRARQLPIDYMLQIEKPGIVTTHLFEGNGYVVRLDEVSSLSTQDFPEHKKGLFARVDRKNKDCVDAGFVASLYRHATIKRNELLHIS